MYAADGTKIKKKMRQKSTAIPGIPGNDTLDLRACEIEIALEISLLFCSRAKHRPEWSDAAGDAGPEQRAGQDGGRTDRVRTVGPEQDQEGAADASAQDPCRLLPDRHHARGVTRHSLVRCGACKLSCADDFVGPGHRLTASSSAGSHSSTCAPAASFR